MARLRHGHCRNGKYTRTYHIWHGMISRCRISHPYYGAKGIRVCERWQRFENFLEDVGEIPPGLTLDRIDGDGHYEPGNVRLATMKQQARNRSTNRLLTIGGIAKTLGVWAEEAGIPQTTLSNRVRWGWPEDRLLVPSRATMSVYLAFGGKTQTISEWARETGLSKSIICKRIKWGWPPKQCLEPVDQHRRRV